MTTKPFIRSLVVTGIAALAGAGLALQAQPVPFPPVPARPAQAPTPFMVPAAKAPLAPGAPTPFLFAQSPRPAAAPRAPQEPPAPPDAPAPPAPSAAAVPWGFSYSQGSRSLFDDNWSATLAAPARIAGTFGSGQRFAFADSFGGFEHLDGVLAGLDTNLFPLVSQLSMLYQSGQANAQAGAQSSERARDAEERARDAAQRARDSLQRARDSEMSNSDAYQSGSRYLDKRDYERALKYFEKVVEAKSARADGATYWKAYTLGKMGRREEALAALTALQSNFPQSRWVNDAKALAGELRQASGQGVSPEKESDEDLKLLAINSLIQSDPDRAVPLLEKLLNDPKNALKLKERALFVLAQTRNEKARSIVASYAKGASSNPDLQMKAVEYLGSFGSKESRAMLGDIYASVSDVAVKRAVLRGFMLAQDKERLFNAAKSEPNTDLRHEAIRYLGAIRAEVELGSLYSSETSVENKEMIIQSMFQTGQADKLLEIAKAEKDVKLRRGAIRGLGMIKKEKTADPLLTLYSSESDKTVKQEIIRALFVQNSAKQLVDVAKKETDGELKRECVRNLSMMKSKDATDYMIEILGK